MQYEFKIPEWIKRDAMRILIIMLIGHLILVLAPYYATLVNEPAFSAWGLFTGGAFYIVALSHILRRLLFNKLDMQVIAKKAVISSTGAGLVVLAMCIVLASFVMVLGAMLRI
jgi:hypothetical protein